MAVWRDWGQPGIYLRPYLGRERGREGREEAIKQGKTGVGVRALASNTVPSSKWKRQALNKQTKATCTAKF